MRCMCEERGIQVITLISWNTTGFKEKEQKHGTFYRMVKEMQKKLKKYLQKNSISINMHNKMILILKVVRPAG